MSADNANPVLDETIAYKQAFKILLYLAGPRYRVIMTLNDNSRSLVQRRVWRVGTTGSVGRRLSIQNAIANKLRKEEL